MPKVGNESYPLYRINVLLNDVRIIYEKCLEREVTKEYIAEVLGQKASGGGFSQKIADLKSYGFLNGGRGKFSVSDIGIKATFQGTPEEKAESLDKAVRNVGLWVAIFNKLGKDPNEETFWLDLAELTGAGRPEAQSKAETVRKAYIDDARYIISVEKPVKQPELQIGEERAAGAIGRTETMESQNALRVSPANISTNDPYLGYPESQLLIVIKDERTFKAAKIFWDAIETEWTEKLKKKKEPTLPKQE